jgi:very-short-patch-repair endonuclease
MGSTAARERGSGGMRHISEVMEKMPNGIGVRTESQPEQKFYEAFLGDKQTAVDGETVWRGDFFIEPQAKIGPFRADFKVGRKVGSRTVDVAVEVDGHKFHAMTPEQVEKDMRRDRAFVRMGVVVLRFSGREVTRDAKACVVEVEQLLTAWLTKAVRR